MSFFYDLNKKLDGIRATPEVTHQQLNERDEGKPGKNFAKIAKDAGDRYGSKAAGERVAGAVRNKLKAQGKLEEGDMDESAFQAAIGKKKYGEEGMKALQKAGRDNASAKTMSTIRNKYDKYDEGVMDTVKSVGKKVAGGINKLVGHGSDEDMIRDLQRKSGAPVTGKKPTPPQQVKEKLSPAKQKSFAALAPPTDKITFADKIAGAKKEVDEMLGDVAAEAMRKALGGGKGRNAEMDEGSEENAFTAHKRPSADRPKVGSTERGHKHDIKHTATGRIVTRRVDDQGNSVGADDSEASGEKRGRGRPKGTKQSIGAKGPSGRSKLMTKEGVDQGQAQQVVDDLAELRAIAKQSQRGGEFPQGFASRLEVVLYAAITLIKNQQSGDAQVREEELDEKAVSKKQQKFMGMVHAAQKGEKPASKEVGKVAKTMKKKDAEDFASTKHKGLPEKAPKKKKEEEVDESTTSGSVATSTATTGGKGGVYGKGIYDSMNFELEQMISESMSINMSDSTEGNKSLTVTATDDDAMKLAVMLKSAGLGGQGRELQSDDHSHGEESCDTCGMPDCGCGDVQEAVDENAPDWPTDTEQADNNFGYSGGLNKPKTDVAGDGQSTVPVVAAHTQDEDTLRRMMEMAGIKQADLEPWEQTMKEDAEADVTDAENAVNDAEAAEEEIQEDFAESIQRMREIAGIKEAKKPDFLDMDKDGDKKEPMSKAIKDKEEKKVDESIFALTNQWKAYKG